MGSVSELSLCYLLRNPWPKPTGALEHCREGETNCWFSIFLWRFLLTESLRRRRISMYISLFTVAIPVNYTSEFREVLKYYTFLHHEPLDGSSLKQQSCFTIGRVPWTAVVRTWWVYHWCRVWPSLYAAGVDEASPNHNCFYTHKSVISLILCSVQQLRWGDLICCQDRCVAASVSMPEFCGSWNGNITDFTHTHTRTHAP
jgi:hypothetical protein